MQAHEVQVRACIAHIARTVCNQRYSAGVWVWLKLLFKFFLALGEQHYLSD